MDATDNERMPMADMPMIFEMFNFPVNASDPPTTVANDIPRIVTMSAAIASLSFALPFLMDSIIDCIFGVALSKCLHVVLIICNMEFIDR